MLRVRTSHMVKGWIVVGVLVAFIASMVMGGEGTIVELLRGSEWLEFYYSLSGRDGAVVVLLGYMLVSMPFVVLVATRGYLESNKTFQRHEFYFACLFIIFWFAMIFHPWLFLHAPGTKWGRTLQGLIKLGWAGAVIEYYFIFGCAVYGLAVLSTGAVRQLRNRKVSTKN